MWYVTKNQCHAPYTMRVIPHKILLGPIIYVLFICMFQMPVTIVMLCKVNFLILPFEKPFKYHEKCL